MAFWLLLLMLTAYAASHEDLSGKMFTFPEETDTANVKLVTSVMDLTAITVCLRFKTDLTRSSSLFSLATPTDDNAFLIYKNSDSDVISIYVENTAVKFGGQDFKLNTWHCICTTWEATNGVVQLWFDGKPTIKKYTGGTKLSSPVIILGQEQDSQGGGFNKAQSFIGTICDVHVWDYVLSPCEITRFMNNLHPMFFTPGNVVNWKALEFEDTGRVLTENKKQVCFYRRHNLNLFRGK